MINPEQICELSATPTAVITDEKTSFTCDNNSGMTQVQTFHPTHTSLTVTGIWKNCKVKSFQILDLCPSSERYRSFISMSINKNELQDNMHVVEPASKQNVECTVKGAVFEVDTDKNSFEKQKGVQSIRKQLRAKRREEIQKFLLLKPNRCSATSVRKEGNKNQKDLTAIEVGKALLLLEEDLKTLRKNFNTQLLDAASKKKSVKDKLQLYKQKVLEINKVIHDDDESLGDILNITFQPDECTNQRINMDSMKISEFYFHRTIHDSIFLLSSSVDLSPIAEKSKEEANEILKKERIELIQSMNTMIRDFDNFLLNVRKVQLNIASKVLLGKLKLSTLSRQMDILLEYESQEQKLRNTLVDEDAIKSAMTELRKYKQSDLESLKTTMLLPLTKIEIDKNPMLFLTTDLKELKDKCLTEKRAIATEKDAMKQFLAQKKCINNTISLLKQKLSKHQNRIQDIQTEKLGHAVDSRFLDMIPLSSHGEITQKKKNEYHSSYQNDSREERRLKDQLLKVTNESTKLLLELASLRENQLKLNEDLKRSHSGGNGNNSKMNDNDRKDYIKFRKVACEQEQEIELLKIEIKSLKTKCGHVVTNPKLTFT